MKKTLLYKAILLTLTAFSNTVTNAQQAVSFDIAAVRNMHKQLNGLNVSSFYHFNEHITGGIELNRFFPVTRTKEAETTQVSAWDFDLNFHYQVPINHHWFFYPVTGISHTSEKEMSIKPMGEGIIERFWSYNTGAGLIWHKGKWAPHAEYLFTWGHMNQQFLLAGFSYEIELRHNHHTVSNVKE